MICKDVHQKIKSMAVEEDVVGGERRRIRVIRLVLVMIWIFLRRNISNKLMKMRVVVQMWLISNNRWICSISIVLIILIRTPRPLWIRKQQGLVLIGLKCQVHQISAKQITLIKRSHLLHPAIKMKVVILTRVISKLLC